MENRRQKQISGELQKAMSNIFQRDCQMLFGDALVTLTHVFVSKDLSIARFYVSVYNVEDKETIIEALRQNAKPLRKKLASKIRHRVKKIPEVEFFLDDSLDKVFRLEKIFKEINKSEDPDSDEPNTDSDY